MQMTQGLGISLQQLAQCVLWKSTPSTGVESGSSVSILLSARSSMNVIGYRQVRWFFRYAQEKLLVFSVLLGYRLLLDSSANFTCISAQNRQ